MALSVPRAGRQQHWPGSGLGPLALSPGRSSGQADCSMRFAGREQIRAPGVVWAVVFDKALDFADRQTFVRMTDGVAGLAPSFETDLQWNLGLPSARD